MTIPLAFNELSLSPTAPDAEAARANMAALIHTLRELAILGVREPLRTAYDLAGMELAPGYPIARWWNDPAVERELRLYWKSRVTQASLLRIDDIVDLDAQQWECLHEGTPALGLGVAYLLNGLAFSLATASVWNNAWVRIRITRLQEDGALEETNESLRHASRVEHLSTHRAWLQHARRTVHDWDDLWVRRDNLFPSLIFCADVYKQVSGLSPGDIRWHAILKRLWELEGYFANWMTGVFNPQAIPCKTTPESESTLQHYADDHTFLCPDGHRRVFTWHVRFTPGAGRIYFEPNAEARKGIIGYIGDKLSTVKYPT